VKAPDGVVQAFSPKDRLTSPPITLSSQESCTETYLARSTGDLFKLEADVAFSADTRSFGIRLFEAETTGEAYEFIFQVGENRVLFDRTPNLPWFRYMNKGLERPLRLDADRMYHIQIIVDDTIATLYVESVALSTRMYAKTGQALAVYVVNGKFTLENAVLETRLK
jgi:beta-fructofuranosidase